MATQFVEKTPVLPLGASPDLGLGPSKDPASWGAASAAKYDTTGMMIPGMTGPQTGQAIKDAVNQLALNNKNKGQVVGPLRQVLMKYAGNYTKKETSLVWTRKDNFELQNWLGVLNAHNTVNPTSPTSLVQWLNLYQGSSNPRSTTALTTNKVLRSAYSIPAQADLTSAAQQAFSSVLGRSASPQEASDFATKYQQLVQSYDSAKINVRAGKSFDAPQTPIQFAQSGQTPTSTAVPSDPTAATGLEAPPTPSVAASNFAAQNNPTQASAQAAADGLGQFLAMLKGS